MPATIQTIAKMSQVGFRAQPGVGLPVSSTYLSLNEANLSGATNPYVETYGVAGIASSLEYGFLGKLYYQGSSPAFKVEYFSGSWTALTIGTGGAGDVGLVLDNYYTGRAGAPIVRGIIFTVAGVNKLTVAASKVVRVSGLLAASYVDTGSVANYDNFREVIVGLGSDVTNFARGRIMAVDTSNHQLVKFDAGNPLHSVLGIVNNLRNFGPTGTGSYSSASDPLLIDQTGAAGMVMFTVQVEGAFDTNGSAIDTGVSGVVAGDMWYASEGATAGGIQNVAASLSVLIGKAAEYYAGVTKLRLELSVGGGQAASSGGGGDVNFVTVPLTSANVNGWGVSGGSLSLGSPAWDTTTLIHGGGALKVIGTNLVAGAYIYSKQFTVQPDEVGQAWKTRVSVKITGTYTDGDFKMVLRDVTNSIDISSDLLLSAAGGQVTVWEGYVFPSTSTVYEWRLIAVNGATRSGSFNLWLGNVSLSPWNSIMAPAVGGRVPWTPVLSTGALGTTTENTAWVKRITDGMQLSWRFKQTGAGTIGSGYYAITVPNNQSIDLAVKPVGSVVGFGKISTAADELAASSSDCVITVGSATTLNVNVESTVSLGVFSIWGSGAYPLTSALLALSFDVQLPISQWSSNIQLASEATVYLSNTESVVNTHGVSAKTASGLEGSPIVADTARTLYDIALPRMPGPTEKIIVEVRSKASGTWVPVWEAGCSSLNFGQLGAFPWGSGLGAGSQALFGIWTAQAFAGFVRVYFGTGAAISVVDGALSAGVTWASVIGASDGYDRWRVRIGKGGANAEVPPVVRAEYTGTSVTAGGQAANFQTKIDDTHSCVQTGADWRFTCKVAGTYLIQGAVTPNAAAQCGIYLLKNGANAGRYLTISQATNAWATCFTASVRLAVGDYVGVTASAQSLGAGANDWIAIVRLGS